MSKLRQSVLECIRIAGNNSGCHQLPERSFFCNGKQFPVCARCTGVFFGEVGAVVLALFRVFLRPSIGFALLICMGLDWLIQELRIRESTNIRRLITGIMGGFGLFSIYIYVLRKFVKAVWRCPKKK